MRSFVILFLIFNLNLFAEDYSTTFLIKVFPESINVTSPLSYEKNLSVIIENKSMINMLGKLTSSSSNFEKIVRVKAGKFQTIDILMAKGESYFFTPLSPPFQSVELKVGQKQYEIPAKK